MELELEAAAGGGSRVVSLSSDAPAADLGRGDLGHGEQSGDRAVSRRHVSLRLLDSGGEPGVAFEVVGRNPVFVRRSSNGRGASISKVFRRGETGELRPGDALALSLKAPSFWVVKRKDGNGEAEVEASVLDAVARREKRTRERKERERLAAEEATEVKEEHEGEEGSVGENSEVDLASVDPVREFGFLSMGHEFDSYPKGRIRPPKDWNWFLEEMKRGSDDEDDEFSNSRGRSKGRGGNKKDGEAGDEDWTDESEDEKVSLSRGPGVKRKKYVTRSKDPKKPCKGNSKVKSGSNGDEDEVVDEEEDEEDETLGGFIVNEEDEAMDELSEEEDEEEEFDDEDDDD